MDVLRNMVDAAKPGRIVLDLQVICPNPRVEVDSRLVCEIDGERWSRLAVVAPRLIEEAVDDHDVRKHYPDGADLVDDFAPKQRRLPDEAVPRLRAIARSVRCPRTLPALAAPPQRRSNGVAPVVVRRADREVVGCPPGGTHEALPPPGRSNSRARSRSWKSK